MILPVFFLFTNHLKLVKYEKREKIKLTNKKFSNYANTDKVMLIY